jgi:hypothetical protein
LKSLRFRAVVVLVVLVVLLVLVVLVVLDDVFFQAANSVLLSGKLRSSIYFQVLVVKISNLDLGVPN